MIYVNNEAANLKDTKSTVGKEYMKALEFFNEIGWPVKFKVKPNLLGRNEDTEGKVYMTMPTYYIFHTAVIPTEYGTEQWRYTPIPPLQPMKGDIQWPTEGRIGTYDKKLFTITKDKADLAFFLWFKSKMFRDVYDIDDARKEAIDRVENEMNAIRLKAAFYSEDSLLQKDKEKLATIARAYNVPRIDQLNDAQRLLELERVIKDMINKKEITVNDFIESLELDILTELSAKIQESIDSKLIMFDSVSNWWYYINEQGQVGDKIVQVPLSKKDTRNYYLRDYFKGHQRELDVFYSQVGREPNKDLNIDFDNLEKLDWVNEILPYINAVGIQTVGNGRKKEDVFKDIRDKCK